MQDWMQSVAEVVLNHQLTIIEHLFMLPYLHGSVVTITALDTCVFPIKLIHTEYVFDMPLSCSFQYLAMYMV